MCGLIMLPPPPPQLILVKFELLPPLEVCEGQGSITSCVAVQNSIERNVEVTVSAVEGTADGD